MTTAATTRTDARPRPPLIAADVGGTYARVGLVRVMAGRCGRLEARAVRRFRCRDFPSLAELLLAFARGAAAPAHSTCVIACSGKVVDGTVINETLAWRVNVPELRMQLPFADLALLNDFEALGYAFEGMRDADALLLSGPDTRLPGPALIVGPGTGLGAVVYLPTPGGAEVLASEAGQMDFAPGTARERAVLATLAGEGGYVACERVLSGPGLLNIYAALSTLDGVPPALASPEAITAAAAAGSDRTAVETVDFFCAALGGFVGSLALAFMARGGVYLAGGVLPHLRGLVQASAFATRLVDKGEMRPFLERVPVRLIEHGEHGLLGAARWYLDRHAAGRHVPGRRELGAVR